MASLDGVPHEIFTAPSNTSHISDIPLNAAADTEMTVHDTSNSNGATIKKEITLGPRHSNQRKLIEKLAHLQLEDDETEVLPVEQTWV